MPATPKTHKRKSTQYKPLTAMQEAYCQSYIKTPENQSQAAIDAGFSPNTAAVKASVMMRDERIQKRIAELMEERNKRNRVSADYVLMRLVEIDQMDVLDTEGTGKLIYTDQPQAWLKYIARVTDVNMFDAIFMEALSWRLAAAINMPLTGSADLGNNALNMYQRVILSAGSHSQNESQEPQPPVDEFTAARLS